MEHGSIRIPHSEYLGARGARGGDFAPRGAGRDDRQRQRGRLRQSPVFFGYWPLFERRAWRSRRGRRGS